MTHWIPFLLVFLLYACLPVIAEVGELDLPRLTIYTPDQLKVLRKRVASDMDAAGLFAEMKREAAVVLNREPQALERIDYEGLLHTDKRRQESVRKLADMRHLTVLLRAWAGSGDETYAEVARKFIIVWTGKYQPTGNPINEDKLEPLLLGYFALRASFTPEQCGDIEAWVRRLADAEAEHPTEPQNWGVKRMKLLAWCGFILNDDKLIDRVSRDTEEYVAASLFADGTSKDLKQRDAMSYHVSGIAPFLQLTIALRRMRPDLPDYYRWQSPTGSSLQRSAEFVLPYARGEKVWEQWRNTTAKIDRDRAKAGLAEYQPGTPYLAKNASALVEWMTFYRPDLAGLAAALRDGKPSWLWLELDCARGNR